MTLTEHENVSQPFTYPVHIGELTDALATLTPFKWRHMSGMWKRVSDLGWCFEVSSRGEAVAWCDPRSTIVTDGGSTDERAAAAFAKAYLPEGGWE